MQSVEHWSSERDVLHCTRCSCSSGAKIEAATRRADEGDRIDKTEKWKTTTRGDGRETGRGWMIGQLASVRD